MKRKAKWLFTVIGLIVYVFLGTLLPNTPLTSRAMVVGVGFDLNEDNTMTVSVQLLMTAISQEGASSNSRVVTAQGSTISYAMDKISKETGLSVTLTHCNVLFFGKSLVESPQIYSALSYLLTNDYLSENAYIFACDGGASEFMDTTMAFGDSASVYTQTLVGTYTGYNTLPYKSLREYLVDYHRTGNANWLPMLTKVEVPKKIPESSELASAGGESGGSGSGSEEDKEYVFAVNSTAIFVKNQLKSYIGSAETSAFCYVNTNVERGSISSKGENDEDICLYILGTSKKMKLDLEQKSVVISVEIDAMLKEIVDYSPSDEYVDRKQLTEQEINTVSNMIKQDIESLFKQMQELDADVFYLRERFYAKFGKKSNDIKLSDISVVAEVKIKI